KGLTNELNAIQQDLYNFDKLAPDRQRMLINEMTRIERQYGLEVGQLMGEFNGEKTLAGKTADLNNEGQRIQNQLAKLQLENYPEQVKQQAALYEQELLSGDMSQKAAEYNLQQLLDPNSVTNRAKAIELEIMELEAKNLPEQQRLKL